MQPARMITAVVQVPLAQLFRLCSGYKLWRLAWNWRQRSVLHIWTAKPGAATLVVLDSKLAGTCSHSCPLTSSCHLVFCLEELAMGESDQAMSDRLRML